MFTAFSFQNRISRKNGGGSVAATSAIVTDDIRQKIRENISGIGKGEDYRTAKNLLNEYPSLLNDWINKGVRIVTVLSQMLSLPSPWIRMVGHRL
jgi:hypothetical protein